jgi:hypothetical protein
MGRWYKTARALWLTVSAPVVVALVAATWSPQAAAAPPPDFYGVWANGTLGAWDPQRGLTMDQQAQLGARHLRQFLYWGQVEWQRGQYDFRVTDPFVADAARRGLRILPVLAGSTDWNTTQPAGMPPRGVYPPSDPNEFAAFASALAARYGPRGRFWFEHPHLPYVPVRSWQVWNEPSIPYFWATGPDARAYTELLRSTTQRIRSVAPDAEVVAAGIPNSTLGSPMISYIREMYRAGAADWFDVMAVHPYAPDVANVLASLRSARREMDANADASPLWASEFGWPTGGPATSLTVSEDQQAALVDAAMRLLADARGSLNLRAVTYFAWRDAPPPLGREFWTEYTGLLRGDGTLKPAALAYARVAAVRPTPIPSTTQELIEEGTLVRPDQPGSPPGDEAPVSPEAPGTAAHPGVMRIVLARPTKRSGGRIALTAGCWSPSGERCQGTLALDTRRTSSNARVRLAARRLSVRSGRHRRLAITLTSRARRLLAARGRLRVRAVARAGNGTGARAKTTLAFWLRN